MQIPSDMATLLRTWAFNKYASFKTFAGYGNIVQLPRGSVPALSPARHSILLLFQFPRKNPFVLKALLCKVDVTEDFEGMCSLSSPTLQHTSLQSLTGHVGVPESPVGSGFLPYTSFQSSASVRAASSFLIYSPPRRTSN